MTDVIKPIGPALPAKIVVAKFQAHFKQLTKDRYGDYNLALGVGKEHKDEAWQLTDYDGMMFDITIEVIPRIKPAPVTSEWDTE